MVALALSPGHSPPKSTLQEGVAWGRGYDSITYSHSEFEYECVVSEFSNVLLTKIARSNSSQVPSAVKALYASPLPEVAHVAPLSESLLTAGELVEWWRWEEERERREFLAPP